MGEQESERVPSSSSGGENPDEHGIVSQSAMFVPKGLISVISGVGYMKYRAVAKKSKIKSILGNLSASLGKPEKVCGDDC